MNLEEMQLAVEAGSVVAPYLANCIARLWDGAKGIVKSTTYKSMIDFGLVFKEYLEFSYSRHNKIKTFIYSNESRPIYSLYVHIDLAIDERRVFTENINDLLDVGNYIVISGTGGSGKSTLLRHLFLNCISETDLIPVLLDLRSLNNLDIKDMSMEEIVFNVLQDYHFKLDKEYFMYSIEQGCYLFVFDGYDELNKEKIDMVGEKIKKMGIKYDSNFYIISSREDDRFAGWSEYIQADMLPMEKDQSIELISKLEFADVKKQLFIKELEEYLYDKHRSFASNPLLLSIMLLTYKENMEIPNNLSEFYEQAYTAMFSRHDTLKDFKREKKSRLSQLEFKDVFAYFCFKSFMYEEYEFTESQILNYLNNAKKNNVIDKEFDEQSFFDDMIKAVCLIVKDGFKYKFSHRSFQEYFAAYYTCKLEDKHQRIILQHYMEKGRTRSKYILMVRDMQKKKFEGIVLVPIGKEIVNIVEKEGWRNLIEKIYFWLTIHINKDEKRTISVCVGRGDSTKKYYGFMEMFSELYSQHTETMFRLDFYPKFKEYSEQLQIDECGFKEINFNQLNDEVFSEVIKYMGLDKRISDLKKIITAHESEVYKGKNVQDLLEHI